MKQNIIYRQGDVMLRVVACPNGLVEAPKGAEILALGEHSGHGHKVEGDFLMLETKEGTRFIDTKKGAKVSHQYLATGNKGDHDTIELPALDEGFVYEVIIQNEFNPFLGLLQQVID